MKQGYVYLLANRKNGTLYLGVTSDLHQRLQQHASPNNKTFTARYGKMHLVWYEHFESIDDAITHEKHMKKYKRQWKIDRIEKNNPDWKEIKLDYDA